MYWELSYEYNNFFVVLPPVDKSVYNTSDLYLMFYARTIGSSETSGTYIIGVMDHDSDTANFVPVDTITATYTAALYTVSFANYAVNDLTTLTSSCSTILCLPTIRATPYRTSEPPAPTPR